MNKYIEQFDGKILPLGNPLLDKEYRDFISILSSIYTISPEMRKEIAELFDNESTEQLPSH